jgi:membrane fusion protein (multidrug efflux system)
LKELNWVVLAVAVLTLSCQSTENATQSTKSFPATTIEQIDTSYYTEYVAEIKAVQNVEIRAKVGGYLDKIFIDEGKLVREGQVMFTINQTEYQNEVARAKANLRSAQAEAMSVELELKNVEQLFAKNVVSKTELEIAKNKLAISKAKLDEMQTSLISAETNLSYTQIKAPFSGVVNTIPFKVGSLIEPGSLLTTLSDNSEVFAYFDVSEKEYLTYAFNALKDSVETRFASLILANGIEHNYKGRIETMEGEIEETTGNIAFRARFKNPERILKHGASGKIRLRKSYNKVVAIPQKATYELQDRVYVYLVHKDGKVESRHITIQGRIPHIYIVSAGLKAGDTILYEGLQDVRDGDIIQAEHKPLKLIFKELANQ